MNYEDEKEFEKDTSGMSVEEFKKYCEKFDDNLVKSWDFDKFKIVCKKCNSDNVKNVDTREYHEGSSCPTCGYESYTTGYLIIKCLNCGNAMQILNSEELE